LFVHAKDLLIAAMVGPFFLAIPQQHRQLGIEKSWHRFSRAEQPNKLHPFMWRWMTKIARATVVRQGIRQGTYDQSALSFIDHDPVFVGHIDDPDLPTQLAMWAATFDVQPPNEGCASSAIP